MSADTRATIVDTSAQVSRYTEQATERIQEGWDSLSGAVKDLVDKAIGK